ncbi:MAG: hypothetical protein AAF623_22030 [Planctomycetota bacterium]
MDLGEQLLTLRTEQYSPHDWEIPDNQHSGWLTPIAIDKRSNAIGRDEDLFNRRASRSGVLAMSLSHYLSLLDWFGSRVKNGKRGSISTDFDTVNIRCPILIGI